MTDEKSLDYSRGYAAGRRRLEKDDAAWKQAAEENLSTLKAMQRLRKQNDDQFRRDVFCASLTGILQNGGWTTGGQKASSVEDYVSIALHFANDAVRRMP